MRRGEILNGYVIETEPTNAGGGMSQWAFATRNGGDYFVKMFLSPKYPLDDSPGSEASKARKRAVCLAFEHRHVEIARRLDPNQPGGGNLVVATDFFRVESTYVKVMPRVYAASLPEPGELTGFQALVLLRSLAYSLRMLHDKDVVHGDLKPDNVMVEHPSEDLYVSKLIDFDEAYVVGSPPDPQHIVGDPIYYSPELLRYIKRDERLPADALTTASDIFSLGLLLHSFLAGKLPDYDRSEANYPAEVLLGGGSLDISAAPAVARPLIARMLSVVPTRRPVVAELVDFLAAVDPEALVAPGDPTAGPLSVSVALEGAGPAAAPSDAPAAPEPSPASAPPAAASEGAATERRSDSPKADGPDAAGLDEPTRARSSTPSPSPSPTPSGPVGPMPGAASPSPGTVPPPARPIPSAPPIPPRGAPSLPSATTSTPDSSESTPGAGSTIRSTIGRRRGPREKRDGA